MIFIELLSTNWRYLRLIRWYFLFSILVSQSSGDGCKNVTWNWIDWSCSTNNFVNQTNLVQTNAAITTQLRRENLKWTDNVLPLLLGSKRILHWISLHLHDRQFSVSDFWFCSSWLLEVHENACDIVCACQWSGPWRKVEGSRISGLIREGHLFF